VSAALARWRVFHDEDGVGAARERVKEMLNESAGQ
jgi:hypothetical protein